MEYTYYIRDQLIFVISGVFQRHLKDTNPMDGFDFGVFPVNLDQELNEEKLLSLAERSTSENENQDGSIIDMVGR